LEDESERGMWSSLFSNNISPRTAVSCALDIAILFSEDPEMVVINFESVINFIIFLASKDVLVEYYLDALLNFGKRFPQFKKELKTILDQEEKNILAPNHAVREVPVRVTCACYDHENYGKEIDGFSAQPVPLLGFLQETKVAGKLLELYEAERKRLDEIGECDINFFYEGESPGWWIESCKYWHNGSDKATVFRLAFEVACLFSENFQAIFNDISRLIHYRWGGLAHRPLMALKAIGQRFPEYRGKLSEVLKRSDVVGNRKVSVTVQLECEDITPGYTSTRNYPACTFQPIYEFEEDLKERYTREELIDFEMVREGMPKNPIEPKKCLVLDCDGVLWSGIADENGTQEIKIHREFQEQIKKLKERGIVLVLNTRNDRNIIEDVFRQHPEMPLKLEDFAVIEANWEPKSKNLLVIAGKLNLGLNSFVFLDDSAQEREMVRKGLPEVFTPGLPGNAELYVPFLMGIAEVFGNRPATEEDKRRTELYAALGKSDTLLTGASSREEGLRLLEMKAGIQIGDMSSIPRLAQVTQRTNQFNLTTHRYNEEDIRRFIQEPGSKVFSLSLADKFADHGIVGLMITRKENEDAYIIETFALSCRALGKTVEQTFMAQVVDILRKEGVKHLRGVYIPTERNGKVKDLYERFGFRKTGEEDNGTTYWELDLEKAKVEASPYITSVPFLP
jgi:FkbH-like protein